MLLLIGAVQKSNRSPCQPTTQMGKKEEKWKRTNNSNNNVKKTKIEIQFLVVTK